MPACLHTQCACPSARAPLTRWRLPQRQGSHTTKASTICATRSSGPCTESWSVRVPAQQLCLSAGTRNKRVHPASTGHHPPLPATPRDRAAALSVAATSPTPDQPAGKPARSAPPRTHTRPSVASPQPTRPRPNVQPPSRHAPIALHTPSDGARKTCAPIPGRSVRVPAHPASPRAGSLPAEPAAADTTHVQHPRRRDVGMPVVPDKKRHPPPTPRALWDGLGRARQSRSHT